jgi:ferredoxin
VLNQGDHNEMKCTECGDPVESLYRSPEGYKLAACQKIGCRLAARNRRAAASVSSGHFFRCPSHCTEMKLKTQEKG